MRWVQNRLNYIITAFYGLICFVRWRTQGLSSYRYFYTTSVNANSKGFNAGVYDGKYIYLVPYSNGSIYGQVTRLLAHPTLKINFNPMKPQLSLRYHVEDCSISTPVTGNMLVYSGTKWMNTDLLSDCTMITIVQQSMLMEQKKDAIPTAGWHFQTDP